MIEPKNPGCAECKHGRWARTDDICHSKENMKTEEKYWGNEELVDVEPSVLNANRDCPWFEQYDPEKEKAAKKVSVENGYVVEVKLPGVEFPAWDTPIRPWWAFWRKK